MKKDQAREIQEMFGKNVRLFRIKRNMTQIDLASKIDCDIRQIQRIEAGEIATSIILAFQIAEELKIEINDLFKS